MKKTIINVGRQFGSGGKRVAASLSEKLGIPVYDSELLVKAAQKSGIHEEFFRGNDESRNIFSLGMFSTNRFGNFSSNGINNSNLFKIQSDAIRDIASNGSAIFVGRASDYILRDMECLDVFITAPLQVRAKNVSEREGISEEEAARMIVKKDKARKEYYDFFTFGDNWGQASNYDLCIDSSILGIEKTADFIIEFGRSMGLI